MENKRFNLASNLAELGASFQKIFLRKISFKDLIKITKGCNPNKQFKIIEEREAKIRENKAKIQAIPEKKIQKAHILTPQGSQGVDQPRSPVDSHRSEPRKSVAKSNHYSQFQGVSRRRQGPNGSKNTLFNQRQKELEPMIQSFLDVTWWNLI
ncbi:hypothetical protein O181_002114 [Austropuccinia psidii MF-1]|uniref:Uncharacterized protein n=1 Tax=Austropuccinia psidii MF-1 TaxID=1389203 RepID=A0A9Q3GCJ4_9BASI|nr:hypothetical protein [Austropuccinia psidii MF-1]